MYRRDNALRVGDDPLSGRRSYFRDLAAIQLRSLDARLGDPAEARERLEQHGREMRAWMEQREGQLADRAAALTDRAEREFTGSLPGMKARGLDRTPFERRAGATTDDASMGYLIPPLWLIQDAITLLRAGRVAADLARQIPLPPSTDTIRIPRLVTGTIVAGQTEGGPVASQNITDDYIEAKVMTIAGQADVSMQLLDLSPGQIVDQVIMDDLVADYNRQVDRDVIRGNGTDQIRGIWPATNWSAGIVATATAAAASGQAFYQTLGASYAKLATQRFSTVNCHTLTHPRRAYWWMTTLDGPSGTVGRPLVGGGMFDTQNAAAEMSDAVAEGRLGRLAFGPHDLYSSSNVPTTDNGSGVLSGTFDPVITAKWDDIWLFESALRMRVQDGPLSATLQVRFQVWNYVAQLIRYGQSIVIAQGAGLAPPTGAIDTAMVFGA